LFAHVIEGVGEAYEQLDPDDPQALAAVARLRVECTQAKEALSQDSEITIPVLLPTAQTEVRITRRQLEAMIRPTLAETGTAREGVSQAWEIAIRVLLPTAQTEVRITRRQLEAMIRPTLAETVTAMERALRSTGLSPDQIDHVLLVGGSSRIPLVAELVSDGLGQPVAVDAHPKHAVALGAALVAAHAAGSRPPPPPPAPTPRAPPPPPAP